MSITTKFMLNILDRIFKDLPGNEASPDQLRAISEKAGKIQEAAIQRLALFPPEMPEFTVLGWRTKEQVARQAGLTLEDFDGPSQVTPATESFRFGRGMSPETVKVFLSDVGDALFYLYGIPQRRGEGEGRLVHVDLCYPESPRGVAAKLALAAHNAAGDVPSGWDGLRHIAHINGHRFLMEVWG